MTQTIQFDDRDGIWISFKQGTLSSNSSDRHLDELKIFPAMGIVVLDYPNKKLIYNENDPTPENEYNTVRIELRLDKILTINVIQ